MVKTSSLAGMVVVLGVSELEADEEEEVVATGPLSLVPLLVSSSTSEGFSLMKLRYCVRRSTATSVAT
uniref:Putative secreted peptide n=1 Tax=Anopheles braziliensis TaxID=58242 RepID=A0A2M3ZN02_9DIPT